MKLFVMVMLLAATRNAAPAPINISASQRLSTLAAHYKGKLSPELLQKVAAGPQRVEIIVLLQEPLVPLPQKVDFSFDPLSAYMSAADRDIESVLQAVPASELNAGHRYRTINGFAADATLAGLEQLSRNPRVRIVQPDHLKKTYRVEGNALMRVAAVHGRSVRGAGVTVAVIDDGVDYSHPELGGTPIGTFPNNVVIGGHDFKDNVTDPSPFPMDEHNSHGTSVAGVIAGRGDSRGGSGVAPEAKIVGLRVGNQDGLSTSATIAALDWIIQRRLQFSPAIRVINMSYGGAPYFAAGCNSQPDVAAEAAAITRAANAGLVLVASAGNEGLGAMGAPACFDQVLSIGAVYDGDIGPQLGWVLPENRTCDDNTTAADQVTCYSNVTAGMTLYAPSNHAFAPRAGGGYNDTFGGTSAASPYTAGVIALLLSKFPQLDSNALRTALRDTGTSLTEAGITTPRVNVDAAYQRLDGTGSSDPCVPGATTLCLNKGRFRVQTTYRTSSGVTGSGQAVSLTADTGYFWFFHSSNVEMVIKLLDACVFGRYWVFSGGLTDVQVTTTVTDTNTGIEKSYTNPLGTAFQPIQDTNAFSTCP